MDLPRMRRGSLNSIRKNYSTIRGEA
jgi:hypothetical protein